MDNVDPSNPLFHARLKVIWADHRTRELTALWNEFSKTDVAILTIKDKPNGTGQYVEVSASDIPHNIGMVLGEAVHCLRSALDYGINAILKRNSKITFPFSEEREELESAFSTNGRGACKACGRGGRKGRYAPIEEASPGIARLFLETIQPYKTGNKLLWLINKLDVREKHRLLAPLVFVNEITGINASDESGNRYIGMRTISFSGEPLKAFGGGFGLKIESYDKPTATPLFYEAGIVESEPIFPILYDGIKVVSETLDTLEAFSRNNP